MYYHIHSHLIHRHGDYSIPEWRKQRNTLGKLAAHHRSITPTFLDNRCTSHTFPFFLPSPSDHPFWLHVLVGNSSFQNRKVTGKPSSVPLILIFCIMGYTLTPTEYIKDILIELDVSVLSGFCSTVGFLWSVRVTSGIQSSFIGATLNFGWIQN